MKNITPGREMFSKGSPKPEVCFEGYLGNWSHQQTSTEKHPEQLNEPDRRHSSQTKTRHLVNVVVV